MRRSLVRDRDARRIATENSVVGAVVHLIVAIEDKVRRDSACGHGRTSNGVQQPDKARDGNTCRGRGKSMLSSRAPATRVASA